MSKVYCLTYLNRRIFKNGSVISWAKFSLQERIYFKGQSWRVAQP